MTGKLVSNTMRGNPPLAAHAAEDCGWLLARMLLIVMLVWVQGLAPFVHAHAGRAQTHGWHLHTGADSALRSASSWHAMAEAAMTATLRTAPLGPEARVVGMATGLVQGREAVADTAPTAPDDHFLPAAGPGVPNLADRTDRVADHHRPSGRDRPDTRWDDRAGLPPLTRAPPRLA